MKVLVTGATGFLGRHTLDLLKATDYQVLGLSSQQEQAPPDGPRIVRCDLTSACAVRHTVWEFQPDFILHLAGRSLVRGDDKNPFAVSHVNILGIHHLLESAPPGCRFIFASSATVYGSTGHMREVESYPLGPSSVYGATKMAGEGLVEAYTQMGRVSGLSLRLVANAGGYSTHGLVHDIVRKLHRSEPTLELIGEPPGSCKPIIWAGDTARSFLYFLTTPQMAPLNIATDDSITVEEVATICMEETGIHKPITWLGWSKNWVGDNPNIRINNDRMKGAGFYCWYSKSADAVRVAVREHLE